MWYKSGRQHRSHHSYKKEEMTVDRTKKLTFFWHSATLDELAEVQGISAGIDIDEIFECWPAYDDPDELLAFLLHERWKKRKSQ